MLNQCGILFVGANERDSGKILALRSLGFNVETSADLPTAAELTQHHAVVIRIERECSLTTLGTRMRARPHFGRRALVALVNADVTERARRDARMSGFDQVLTGTFSARDIAAAILRVLRGYPEYRCLLRAPNGRRKAA